MVLRAFGFSCAVVAVISGVAFCHTEAVAKSKSVRSVVEATKPAYEAEAKLIAIYKLIGAGQAREALILSSQLVKDFPNFQLAHLVHGDLLTMQARPVKKLGELPEQLSRQAGTNAALSDLREESLQRVRALQERPASGTVPSQVLGLSSRNKHVIAVDTGRSRLYVLENTGSGLNLIMDTYISVGKEGIGKYVEGDFKTPLGVYYLTTKVDPKLLTPLYGAGAIPINYPNPYDLRLGKSGSGIWLHGSMPERFARPVKASDGCVVLSNPDLQRLMTMVAVKTTPVIIASKLDWVKPEQLIAERHQFESTMNSWRDAKNRGQLDQLRTFYMPDFKSYGKTLSAWWPSVEKEMADYGRAKNYQWRDVTTLAWHSDLTEKPVRLIVLTFDEVPPGRANPVTKRQYWLLINNQWKIFFEGAIAAT